MGFWSKGWSLGDIQYHPFRHLPQAGSCCSASAKDFHSLTSRVTQVCLISQHRLLNKGTRHGVGDGKSASLSMDDDGIALIQPFFGLRLGFNRLEKCRSPFLVSLGSKRTCRPSPPNSWSGSTIQSLLANFQRSRDLQDLQSHPKRTKTRLLSSASWGGF